MKVFVTGSESFIGAEFISLCQAHNVTACGIDLCAPSLPGRALADIRSAETWNLIPADTDAIVHLAAISRDIDCRARPQLAYDVNVMGTINMLEAARNRGIRQFIFASTEWVYGEVANQATQTEGQAIDVTRVRSEYALSKIIGEQALRLAYEQGRMPTITILRFGIVYGRRTQNLSAFESLVNQVILNKSISVGSRRTARRFIHVQDIASGIMAALTLDGFDVLNLSGNCLIELGDIIDESARLVGCSPRFEETTPLSISIRNPDNTRARFRLAWEPRFDLAAGVRDIVQYFQVRKAA